MVTVLQTVANELEASVHFAGSGDDFNELADNDIEYFEDLIACAGIRNVGYRRNRTSAPPAGSARNGSQFL
ncbi:hypothetical+protein [Methylocapsa aurea]|uniref:hypothetical protein n=1 Tax=Methylocapsa aurea TaxID=663610 RepID=UPI003D18E231